MTVSIERVFDLADRSARKAARNHSEFDDLRQEAAIKGWKASLASGSEAYVQKAIVYGIADAIGGVVTGSPATPGTRKQKGLETELSDVIEEKYVGTEDSYPSLTDDVDEEGAFEALVLPLDPIKREVMTRLYRDGQSPEEVRNAMGLTRAQVSIHHRWAKEALRKHLKESAR